MKEIYPLCADRLHDEVLLHRTTALLNVIAAFLF